MEIAFAPGFLATVVGFENVLGRFRDGKVDGRFSSAGDVAKSENRRLEGRTMAGVAGGEEESVDSGDEGG